MRTKSTITDANEKKLDPARLHEVRQLQCGAFEGAAFWHQWRGVQQVRYERADSQGVVARKVVLLLDLLEFVAGVNRVTSLCGDVRHLPTLIDILTDQVQWLGSRDVNLDAA